MFHFARETLATMAVTMLATVKAIALESLDSPINEQVMYFEQAVTLQMPIAESIVMFGQGYSDSDA